MNSMLYIGMGFILLGFIGLIGAGVHGSLGQLAVHAAAAGASRISQWMARLAHDSCGRSTSGEAQARLVGMKA
jgi:hypothetical protein